VFLTPQSGPLMHGPPRGPQIVDNQGRPVWFRQIPDGQFAASFRVQTYRGQDVLTWWEGTATMQGNGSGVGYIADKNYRIIATVQGEEPYDFHEFRLTPWGTAIVVVKREQYMDLRPLGGQEKVRVDDNGFREVDVETGRVIREWWSLDHVPVAETYEPLDAPAVAYFHLNSVDVDFDGNFIVSGRHTKTVYKVDRRTGEIIWRLGGRNSDFSLGDGAEFHWQHDAVAEGRNLYRIFDNSTKPGFPTAPSRVVWLKVDPHRKAAMLVRQIVHPDGVSANLEGGSHRTPDGNTVVGWGTAGRVSEFTPDGSLVWDASLPDRHSTYRAYRFVWNGRPATDPVATLEGEATVHAVWNGATGVARWRVLGGGSERHLKRVTEAPWNGLDTPIELPDAAATKLRYIKVQALDAWGRVIGASPVTPTGR
jgi:outer membrane protein assembly factor BamB